MVWERWVGPRSTDERRARQERLVNILAVGGTIAGLAYLLAVLIQFPITGELEPASIVGGGLCAGLAFLAYRLSRGGWVRPAAILVVIAATFVGLYSVFMRGGLSVAAVVLAPAIVFAGMAVGRRAAWITTLAEIGLYIGLVVLQEKGVLTPPIEHSWISAVGLTAVALGVLGLLTVQTLVVIDRSLRRSLERENALRTAAEEKDRLLTELQAREEARRRLLEMIHELGSPIIPLAERVIAMPLIGAVDSERAQGITRALLYGVAEHRAHTVLVDITGVPVVDTDVAGALIRAMAGVRLLGARPVLTGIRAEVAQTLVALGLDLSGITTRATLEEGLAYALEVEMRQ